jgi:hypothetical protein
VCVYVHTYREASVCIQIGPREDADEAAFTLATHTHTYAYTDRERERERERQHAHKQTYVCVGDVCVCVCDVCVCNIMNAFVRMDNCTQKDACQEAKAMYI